MVVVVAAMVIVRVSITFMHFGLVHIGMGGLAMMIEVRVIPVVVNPRIGDMLGSMIPIGVIPIAMMVVFASMMIPIRVLVPVRPPVPIRIPLAIITVAFFGMVVAETEMGTVARMVVTVIAALSLAQSRRQ